MDAEQALAEKIREVIATHHNAIRDAVLAEGGGTLYRIVHHADGSEYVEQIKCAACAECRDILVDALAALGGAIGLITGLGSTPPDNAVTALERGIAAVKAWGEPS